MKGRWEHAAFGLCLAFLPLSVQAFSALVSPPRIVDAAKPGHLYRNVIDVTNVAKESARFMVASADWALDKTDGVVFSEALAPSSCRPWLALEAREIKLAGGERKRLRFEVDIPADTPPGECRFAIMIEGEPQAVQSSIGLPVSGRIGVIVYLKVGDASANLQMDNIIVIKTPDKTLPAVRIRNSGNAHGRLEGMLDGVDAKGHRLTFAPGGEPILPGSMRDILLTPIHDPAAPGREIVWPVKLKGHLDWDDHRLEVNATVSR
jgi:hypothetical protein